MDAGKKHETHVSSMKSVGICLGFRGVHRLLNDMLDDELSGETNCMEFLTLPRKQR